MESQDRLGRSCVTGRPRIRLVSGGGKRINIVMQDQFHIIAHWLVAVLAVMGLCGLWGCWMLFRMWWRRQYHHRKPLEPSPAPEPAADIWQLSGQRLFVQDGTWDRLDRRSPGHPEFPGYPGIPGPR